MRRLLCWLTDWAGWGLVEAGVFLLDRSNPGRRDWQERLGGRLYAAGNHAYAMFDDTAPPSFGGEAEARET